MSPILNKFSAFILLLTFPFTQTGWSADAIQMIDGQPQAVADPFTASTNPTSSEPEDFLAAESPLSVPEQPALLPARISIAATAGLTVASVTTLGGSPRPYLVAGTTAETTIQNPASNVVQLNYKADFISEFSAFDISFDNASTSAVETRSISALSQITVGLKGATTVVRMQIEDVSGKIDEIDLNGVSASVEKFWRIPVASISSALDKTKIKSIRFLVSPSNGGLSESGALSVRVNGMNLALPATPVVVPAAPTFTNQSTLTLSGTKEANTSILINGIEILARDGSTTWTAQVALPLVGANAIKVTAKNSIGKVSAIRSLTITKDIVGPAGTININSGAAYAASRTVTLNLSAVDINGSGVRTMSFSTDGRTWSSPEAYKTSKSFLLPEGDGAKTVYVKYFDKAGNQSMSYFKSIILDLLPPSGTVTVGNGSGFINSRTATLYLNAADSGSGLSKMSFSANGTTWIAAENYASQKSWAFSAGDGAKKVYVKFQDKTGKWSAPILVNVVLDVVNPTGDLHINGGGAYANSNPVQLNLSAADIGGGIGSMSFSTDNVNWTSSEAFAASKTFELPSGDGSKMVFVKYFDKAGNASAVYSKLILLDSTAPEVGVVLFDGKTITRELSGNAAFTASDSGSGLEAVRYSLDQGTTWTEWGAFTSENSVSLPEGDGRKQIIYEARDAAGNIASSVGSITVDQIAPILELLTSASVVRVGVWVVEYLSDGVLKSKSYQLSSGINALTLSETDEAGNTSSLNFNVEYEREWDVVSDNGTLQHYEAGVLKYEILLEALPAGQSESNEGGAENLNAYLSAPPEYEVQSSLELPQIQVYEGENLQAAIDSAQAGQTVYLHPGTYNGHFVLKSGVNLIGADQGSVVLHGNFESKKDVLQAIGDNRIENLTITGGGPYNWEPSSALNILGDHVLIRSNKISGNKDYGIYVSAQVSDVVIEKNLIQGNNVGVQLPKDGNQIRSNTFVGNNFAVNILNGTAPVVENNIIVGSTYQSIYEFGYGLVPTNGRAIIRNNTLHNNAAKGGYSSLNLPPAIESLDGNGWTQGNILQNPQFVNPAVGNYSVSFGTVSFGRGAFVPEAWGKASARAALFNLNSTIEEMSLNGAATGYRIIYPAGTVETFMNDGTEILDTTGPDIVISEQNPVLVNQSEYQLIFSVDGGEEAKSFTLTEGSNLFTVEASDELGNRTVREFRVTLDTISPVIAITSQIPSLTNSPNLVVDYTVDGLARQKIFTLAEGNNNLSIAETDEAGNAATLNLPQVTLDTVAPQGSVSVNAGNAYTDQSAVMLELSASDAGTGVAQMRFSNDGVNWSIAEAFATVKSWMLAAREGLKNIFVQFADAVGNWSEAIFSQIFVDTSVPTGAININSGAVYSTSQNVTLSLTANDTGSGIEKMSFSADGINWSMLEDYAAEKDFTLLAGDGTKTVYVRYYDKSGKVSEVYSKSIILDTITPTIAVNSAVPLQTNQGALIVGYTVDGMFKQKSFNLVEGPNNLTITETDLAGNSATQSFTVVLDTIPPTITNSFPAEGVIVSIPYIAVSYDVNDSGDIFSKYQEIDLQEGINTIQIREFDAIGNEALLIKHIYYEPEINLDLDFQALRERFIQENVLYFQEGEGIDASTGFPIDVIGTNAPDGIVWTQPTSIGFYLQLLGEIITKRLSVDFLTQEQAISQAEKVMTSLLQVQDEWGWNGLIPWLRLEPVFEPSTSDIALIDNANLTQSLATLAGTLSKANLQDSVAGNIYTDIEIFLANQELGYQSFVDPISGVFRGTYNVQTQSFEGYADRFGNEIRATIPFLVSYFNLPDTVWTNLIRSKFRYLTQQGRVVETFGTFDGGGFQYFWPLLRSPEESLPNINKMLQNALLIFSDFMDKNGLPGFASAASLPEGGYNPQIGIEGMKEHTMALDEAVGSIYSLAAAYRLNPEFVLSLIESIETDFPSLKGALGFYDSARATGEVSLNYYSIDQGSLVLGLLGASADDFKYWMQKQNLWIDYQSLYADIDFDISQSVETLPEPPLAYEEIHNGRIDTGNVYSGQYAYNQSGIGFLVSQTADGAIEYIPNNASAWSGGYITPPVGLDTHAFVDVLIRNTSGATNAIDLELKNNNTLVAKHTIELDDAEWQRHQFFFSKTSSDINFINFTNASGSFEVKDMRFTNRSIFLGAFPPLIQMTSSANVSMRNYLLQYNIGGLIYEEPIVLQPGANTITRVFHDVYGREINHLFSVFYDSNPPVITLTSAVRTTNHNYALTYTVDGVLREESITLTEGLNQIVRSAQNASGSNATVTFQVVLDSQPPVLDLFRINQGAVVTKSRDVTLDLLAFDLGSRVTLMALSNDGVNFSEPEPFSTSKVWTLKDGKGEKTVWVKIRDESGFWSNPETATVFYEKAFVIDDFDGASRVETYWDRDGTDVYQRSFEEGDVFQGSHAMVVNYQKSDVLNYSFFGLNLIQDGMANDFSSFKTLRMQVKKVTAPPMVLMVKMEFVDSQETFEKQIGFPQDIEGWQEAVFDFSSLSPDLLRNVKKILFFVDPGNTTSQGSFIIDSIVLDEKPPTKTLDDFEGNGLVSTWWDWDADLIYQRNIQEETSFDGTHSMRVNFAKQANFPFAFFAAEPAQDGFSNNFSNYGSLRFMLNKIHDNPMALTVKIEFHGTDDTTEQEFHFPQGSGDWQEVVFDLTQISATRLTRIKNIHFYVDPASEATTGAFYIDHLRLAEKPFKKLIDDFEGNDSLIETWWDGDGSSVVYTRTIDNTEGNDGTHAMRIEYDKSAAYPTSFFAFAPKQDGVANDFSQFNVLKLALKKESVPAMKLMMKLELADTQINVEAWKEIPIGQTGWVEVAFDLSALDASLLDQVEAVIFLVDPIFFATPQASSGVFFIDSIELGYDSNLLTEQYDPSKPPQIGWVSSSVVSDLDNQYRSGNLVRLNAWELNAAGDLLDGSIRVVSPSTGYDSGEQKLIFTHDGQFWPFHWNTRGLPAANDYGVIVTMKDKAGNVTTVGTESNPALTIELTAGVPGGASIVQITDTAFPSSGFLFPVSRSYNTADATIFDHQLGLGWHSNLDVFAQDFPDGTVSLNLGADGYHFYSLNEEGGYSAHNPGDYSTLTKLTNGFELRLKDGTVYELTSAPFVDLNTRLTLTWFVSRIIDRNGNEITFFYDENRNPTSVVSSSGQTLNLTYSLREIDQFNTKKFKLDQMADADGNTWLYGHDVRGLLTSVTDPLGNVTAYTYGLGDRLSTITYPDASTKAYEYDSNARVTRILLNGVMQNQYIYGAKNDPVFKTVDALGRISSTKISLLGLVVETINPLGHITRYAYDDRFNLIEETNAQGSAFFYSYDDKGNLTEAEDALGYITQYAYDPISNQVTALTDALGEQSIFTYDANGNFLALTDPDLNLVELIYNGSGYLTQLKNQLGQTIDYTYYASGLVHTATDAHNNVTTYEYDSRGNATKVINALIGVTLFEYDALGRLVKKIDPLGHEMLYVYDSMGRLLSVTDALGQVESYIYDLAGRLTSVTNVMGDVTQFAYDAVGNLTSQIDALGNVSLLRYDALNQLVEVEDALGRVSYLEYNLLGNLITSIDALGNETHFEYDKLGRLTKTILADNSMEQRTYDALGQLLTVSDARGNTTQYAYDARGNVTSTTNALGKSAHWTYDALNQLVSETSATGDVTNFEYDELGRVEKAIYADGSFETFVYDALGRLTQVVDPMLRTKTLVYDAVGNLTQTIDSDGNSTQSEYDELNRKVKDIDALGNETVYTYDALGRVTQILDARLNATTFTYDKAGRVTEVLYPDGSTETSVYDKVGNVLISTDRMGRSTTSTYDALNRVTRRVFYDASEETYTYDEFGNVLTMVNSEGMVRNEYNSLGQLTKTVDVFGNILTYTYDALGNRKTLTSVIGTESLSRTYTYDDAGRLIGIVDQDGKSTQYTYDARSRVSSRILPNSASSTLTYNAASDLTSISHKDSTGQPFRVINYDYESRGLISEKNDSSEGISTFNYDELARLVSVTQPMIGLTVFALDEVGNRAGVTEAGVSDAYVTNNLNQYVQVGSEILLYDMNGNLLERQDTVAGLTTQYDYDAENRLTSVALSGGDNVIFAYDALGRRISKTSAAGSTRYLWDGNELLAELDASGNLIKSYAHGLSVDEVLYQTDHTTGETLYFHQDHQMSTVALTSESGSLVESFAYDAYGNLTDSPSLPSTNFLFTGREYDSETGLYFNRNRYYDPSMGRFITADPMGFDAGINFYTYGLNNPLTFRDPQGLDVYYGGSGGGGGYNSGGGSNSSRASSGSNYNYTTDRGNHGNVGMVIYAGQLNSSSPSYSGTASTGSASSAGSSSGYSSGPSTGYSYSCGSCGSSGHSSGGTYNSNISGNLGSSSSSGFSGSSGVTNQPSNSTSTSSSGNPVINNISVNISAAALAGFTMTPANEAAILEDAKGIERIPLIDDPVLNLLFMGGVVKSLFAGAAKTIVIGESMTKRVIPTAEKIGAEWFQATGKGSLMQENRRWLFNKIRKGYSVVDIGIDTSRTVRSIYYQMEQEVLRRVKKIGVL